MSQPFNKSPNFAQNIALGKHAFGTNNIKFMLTDQAPTAGMLNKADVNEISAVNGYPSGGATMAITVQNISGNAVLFGTDITFQASGGSFGPFRYAWAYDSTQNSPLQPLLGYYDYAQELTLNNGEPFTIHVDPINGLGSIAVL